MLRLILEKKVWAYEMAKTPEGIVKDAVKKPIDKQTEFMDDIDRKADKTG